MSVFDAAPRVGNAKSFYLDDAKEITCSVFGDDELKPEVEKARLWQPPGHRARPVDDPSEGYYCLYIQYGDEVEVLALTNRDATAALGDLEPGATQTYSLGPKPQAITITDSLLMLGTDAKQAAVKGNAWLDADQKMAGALAAEFKTIATTAATAAAATMDAASATFFTSVAKSAGAVAQALGDYQGGATNYLSSFVKLQ